jgi:hypothetical protein
METPDSSETSINFYETTRRYVQEDSVVQSHQPKYLKSTPLYIATGKRTNIHVFSEKAKYLLLSNMVYIWYSNSQRSLNFILRVFSKKRAHINITELF